MSISAALNSAAGVPLQHPIAVLRTTLRRRERLKA
jgi:hypothetical protein